MKISTLIISKSTETIRSISNFTKESEFDIEVVSVMNSAQEGYEFLQDNGVNLLFWDVEIEGEASSMLLHELKAKEFEVKTIFIADRLDHSIQAIRNSAIDYILKPVTNHSLTSSIERYLERYKNEEELSFRNKKQIATLKRKLSHLQADIQPFPIPTMDGMEFILISDITRCKSDSNTCDIYVEGRSPFMQVNYTLKELEAKLEAYGFIRVHQSHLVNKSKIRSLLGKSLFLRDGDYVPVSRRNLQKIKNGFRCL